MRILARLVAVSLVAAWPAKAEVSGADPAAPLEQPADRDEALRGQRLDTLFAALKSAKDTAEGQAIERDILRLWHQSGDAKVDRLLNGAMVAMSARAFPLALDYLDTIVTIKPDFAEGWNKRATAYFMVSRYAESMADVEKTLALEPRHFGALAGLGMIMLRIGDTRRAIAAFKEAVAVNPNLDNIQETIIRLEGELGQGI